MPDIPSQFSALFYIEVLKWPLIALLVLYLFYPYIIRVLLALEKRLNFGSSISPPWDMARRIKRDLVIASSDEPISEEHLALTHESQRTPNRKLIFKHDAGESEQEAFEFGKESFEFSAIILGHQSTLDRISKVVYTLPESYSDNVHKVTSVKSGFELKYIAYQEFVLKAEIFIENQDEPIELSRYINFQG